VSTVAVLIPKVDSPAGITQRLMSLYNVIYKIISKMLAGQLKKKILAWIISEAQSVFVSRRLIIKSRINARGIGVFAR
jgi:predicted glycosyltransferase